MSELDLQRARNTEVEARKSRGETSNEKFTKNNKFVKLEKLEKEYEKKKKIAESEFKDFAFQNFAINDDDMRVTTNVIVINSLNSNKKDYQPKEFPRYIYEIKV